MLSPSSDKEFKNIAKYLLVLGLKSTEVPSVQEYRRKYKTLLRSHHPDKGSKDEKAKEITEAARAVF